MPSCKIRFESCVAMSTYCGDSVDNDVQHVCRDDSGVEVNHGCREIISACKKAKEVEGSYMKLLGKQKEVRR